MQPVLDYLRANEPRFVNELCDYVRFPSVSAQPEHKKDLQNCADWLLKRFSELGFDARLVPTAGHPVVLAKAPRQKNSRKKHFVVYGHYDVQPPDPLDLWQTPPFEPTIRGRSLYGRGASDNKGQNLAHLKAVEAYLKTGTELPCDLTFVLEGEEEVGSDHLADFLEKHKTELACESVVISDTGMPSKDFPALTYALRGILALEVHVFGPSRDLHSGIYGGTVDNPAMVLCQLLAQLRDKRGRIAIPGLYDDVEPLSRYERQQMARLPFKDPAYRKFLGVPELFGEKGFTTVEQRSARPTCEINGLTSGYQGEGSKTIIPSHASAKLTLRLVPNQTPKKVLRLFQQHLKKIAPPTVRVVVEPGHAGDPYLMDPTSNYAQAALRTMKQAFGKEPVIMREGGSIPIVNDFKRILRSDTLLMGLALPDDNAHSPNEKFDLDIFGSGMRMGALLWQELAKV